MFTRLMIVWTAIIPTAVALKAQTPVVPPDVSTFLQKFNAGAFTDGRFARWFSLYGPLEARSVELGPDGATIVWTRGLQTRAWLGFIARGTYEDYTVLSLAGAPPKPELREHTARSRTEAAAAIVEYLQTQATADRFSGVVLVAVGDSILLRAAYGAGIDPHTTFSIASVGKVFTAVAVAQLKERGALSYDDHVSRFLPAFRTGHTDPTIRQLLSHTSGVGRIPDWMREQHDRSIAALANAIAHAPPEFAAGDDVRYSNEGYVVLGAIVERVAGVSFLEYLRQHIFLPAAMPSTGLWTFAEAEHGATPLTLWRPGDAGNDRFAGGHRVSAVPFLRIRGTPAGGTVSAADDLNRFLRALWSGKLVSPGTLAELTTEHIVSQSLVPPPPGMPRRPGFGYGFEVEGASGTVAKVGGALGVSAYISVTPATRVRVIVLSNYDSIAPLVAHAIEELTCCLQ